MIARFIIHSFYNSHAGNSGSENSSSENNAANKYSESEQVIEARSFDTRSFNKSAFASLIAENHDFYDAVIRQRPEKSPAHLLLGLMTKLHIESLGFVQSHSEQMKAMEDVFKTHLPEKHATQFHATDLEKLELVTKIWLYLQGFNQLDFSLANDHAYESSLVISQVLHTNLDEKRTEFIAFYYQGKEVKEQRVGSPKKSFIQKLLNLLRG